MKDGTRIPGIPEKASALPKNASRPLLDPGLIVFDNHSHLVDH
jgi:hypothetical protein